MRQIITLGICWLLLGCSTADLQKVNAALDKYDQSLDNFNAIVARVNQSVAKTDATAKPYCTSAITVGQNVGKIVKGNDTAQTVLDEITSGLTDYCTGPINSVSDAVVYLSQAIADGKAVLGK